MRDPKLTLSTNGPVELNWDVSRQVERQEPCRGLVSVLRANVLSGKFSLVMQCVLISEN